MTDVDLGPLADGVASSPVDRRTLLAGAAGTVAAAGLSGPARAAGHAASLTAAARPRFDPELARQLQRALRAALRDPGTTAPGAILHVRSPRLGRFTGVAGLGRVAPDVPMRRADRFRAGSIAKTFVAVAVLQLAERDRLSLDARLPQVLPARVVDRFPTGADVTVRMLLNHRSGIPDWNSPAIEEQVARHPAKLWKVSEFLDLAAAQPPLFAPGTGFFYSSTNYNLLGLIIERITGRSWRRAVTRGVIRPLRLTSTDLPAPRDRSIKGQHAHGYLEFNGKRIDITRVDPSFAGAAGACALVTTVHDLARFLDALLRGRLFRRRATLSAMLDLAPAQGEGGLVGYGLGLEQYALPGGVELVGHLGGTAGYRSFVGRVRPLGVTMTLALNAQDDPTPLIVPAVQALAATHR
jgi:D-alanyl-D-alanine carboxypeptidase